MRPRYKRETCEGIIINVSLFFASFLVTLLILELSLRLIYGNPLYNTKEEIILLLNDSELRWELVPNNEGILAGAYYKTDKSGFRDDNKTKEKKEGVIRIAAVGDSVTFGMGVPLEDSFSKKLETLLNSRCNQRYEVLNFGIPGYNTRQEYLMIKNNVLRYNPDIILINYVLNDPMEFNMSPGLRSKKNFDSFLFENFMIYKALVLTKDRFFYEIETKKIFVLDYYSILHEENSPEWNSVVSNLENIEEIGKTGEIPVYLFVFPELYNLDSNYPFKKIDSQVVNVSEKIGINARDLFPYFEGKDYRELRVQILEDRHPNSLGHLIAAEGIFDNLKEDICNNTRITKDQ